MKKITLMPLLLLSLGTAAQAADYASYSGAELFKRFCATCHGAGAQGDGPVAASLNVTVPDLRLLAARRRGVFPTERIEQIIDGRAVIGAHGSRTMPVWGEEFLRTEIGNPEAERATAALIQKIVVHLRDIQVDASGAPLK